MLILFDLPKDNIHAFNSYSALYNHLENLERIKRKGNWIFAQHSWQHMMSCYRYVRDRKAYLQSAESFEQGLEEALKQAVAGRLVPANGERPAKSEATEACDIIEITSGNATKPVFIRVSPEIDINALRQEWCRNYCKGHGLPLFEITGPADFKETGGRHDHVAG